MTALFQAAVAALVGWVVYRLVTGTIRTDGLLASHADAGSDPERVQMLVVWLGGVGVYASQALALLGSPARALPDVPEFLLWGMTGSQTLYLVGKLVRTQGR